ncbi:hypothetical protein C8J57DRAFT_1492859 [Mycena rebaudengoi]|nr:hypothetical protein C8J57DRAFT_1492859 [Mycena rebaudengoi]
MQRTHLSDVPHIQLYAAHLRSCGTFPVPYVSCLVAGPNADGLRVATNFLRPPFTTTTLTTNARSDASPRQTGLQRPLPTVGSFVGLLVSNTHDLLYDLATSNFMSSVMYAAAAGIVEDNLHCIFATSVVDAIARRLCASTAEENTLFGDNAPPDIALDEHESAKTPEIFESVLPELCPTCMVSFKAALDAAASDEIHAVEGLPAGVVGCRAVARASMIRRAAIIATEDKCCDVCACRIGCWCDIVSHMGLTALMAGEHTTSSTEWVLQCYAVWAVMTSPVSVATVLSGFDLICEMRQEKGAMGNRDVLDC